MKTTIISQSDVEVVHYVDQNHCALVLVVDGFVVDKLSVARDANLFKLNTLAFDMWGVGYALQNGTNARKAA